MTQNYTHARAYTSLLFASFSFAHARVACNTKRQGESRHAQNFYFSLFLFPSASLPCRGKPAGVCRTTRNKTPRWPTDNDICRKCTLGSRSKSAAASSPLGKGRAPFLSHRRGTNHQRQGFCFLLIRGLGLTRFAGSGSSPSIFTVLRRRLLLLLLKFGLVFSLATLLFVPCALCCGIMGGAPCSIDVVKVCGSLSCPFRAQDLRDDPDGVNHSSAGSCVIRSVMRIVH